MAAVYFPAGGTAHLTEPVTGTARWFDPRTGALTGAKLEDPIAISAPEGVDEHGRPLDWVLVVGNS